MAFDRRRFLAGLLACPLCAAAARADSEAHWSYDCPDGPSSWGSLDQSYRACTVGAQQSPIDLVGERLSTSIGVLTENWPAEAYTIENNGHTIQAAAQTGSLVLDGRTFALQQFHFHTPSEHTLMGHHHDLEAHFVHQNAEAGLAVVGVFLQACEPNRPCEPNKAFATIMANAPQQPHRSRKLERPLDVMSLLPESRTRYRYEGSLTIPPCFETVDWNIYENPVWVAKDDFNAFKNLYSHNARPPQSLNRRFLLKG
jgi:carbonic anhydrase